MQIRNATDVPQEPVQQGITIRWLIAEKEGAPNFAMRLLEFQPGAIFAPHRHPYEHEIYVLEGKGVVTGSEGDVGEMRPGATLLISPNELHGYRNTGETPLRFICVIPLRKG